MPTRWKEIDCPTCGAKAGEPCGRRAFGAPWRWERTAPHVSRKRTAPPIEDAGTLVDAREPIPMILHCPDCKTQHIDAPEPEKGWTNPPHKSHLCHGCGLVWRPADVPTVGVASIGTRGDADTWPRAVPAAT